MSVKPQPVQPVGTVSLTLPWPPSVNHTWLQGRSHAGKRVTYLSEDSRTFRAAVKILAHKHRGAIPAKARVSVHILAQPPERDRRGRKSGTRRDLDNILKATLDALTHAGVWPDDSQIDDLRVTRCAPVPGGAVLAVIRERGDNPGVVYTRATDGKLDPE